MSEDGISVLGVKEEIFCGHDDTIEYLERGSEHARL